MAMYAAGEPPIKASSSKFLSRTRERPLPALTLSNRYVTTVTMLIANSQMMIASALLIFSLRYEIKKALEFLPEPCMD